MTIETVENALINANFVVLFFTMICYWLKTALFLPQKLSNLPNNSLIISSLFQTSFLFLRWFSSGHFPLSDLYESLLFLSWFLTNLLLILNRNNQMAIYFSVDINKAESTLNSMIGSIITPLILMLNSFSTFGLPSALKISSSLVPALQSNWLLMHVTAMILSYATLFCGCLFSMAYIIVVAAQEKIQKNNKIIAQRINQLNQFMFNSFIFRRQEQNTKIDKSLFIPRSTTPAEEVTLYKHTLDDLSSFDEYSNKKLANFKKTLDNLSYRILGLGFPLLTLGILSGAVWANQTWGSYWSWDRAIRCV